MKNENESLKRQLSDAEEKLRRANSAVQIKQATIEMYERHDHEQRVQRELHQKMDKLAKLSKKANIDAGIELGR